MADMTLTPEDREAVRDILLAERERGVLVPLLPADVDLDGDGTTDAYGLDENDEVTIVSGVDLSHTLYVAEGEGGIEAETANDAELEEG